MPAIATNLTCLPVKYCNPASLPGTSNNETKVLTNYSESSPVNVGEVFGYFYMDYTDYYTCLANGSWFSYSEGTYKPAKSHLAYIM
jgi:hypothetical protein